jgi:hypothetical protein
MTLKLYLASGCDDEGFEWAMNIAANTLEEANQILLKEREGDFYPDEGYSLTEMHMPAAPGLLVEGDGEYFDAPADEDDEDED